MRLKIKFFKKYGKKHLPLMLMFLVLAVLLIPSSSLGVLNLWDAPQGLEDVDNRKGKIEPSADQLANLDQPGIKVDWNQFGTIHTLSKEGGYLAVGLKGNAVEAARQWILNNNELFRLSPQSVSELELVNDARMPYSNAHYVLFRQKFGNLKATQDGLINVAIINGKVFHVWSSSAGDQDLKGSVQISPADAWLTAAAGVNYSFTSSEILSSEVDEFGNWTLLEVSGLLQKQQVRLTALPTPQDGARMAYEVNVVNVKGHIADAYTAFIDAENGELLYRVNRVDHLMSPETQVFQGSYQDAPAPQACGPRHAYTVPAGKVRIAGFATASIPANDIVLNLYFNNGVNDILLVSGDTGTSPETVTYEPVGGVPAGVYKIEVCPYNNPSAPPQAPYSYAGTFTTDDTPTPGGGINFNSKWKYWLANPDLNYVNTDLLRKNACWRSSIDGTPVPGCQREEMNIAARAPWDWDINAGQATLTTRGNAAQTAESWGSPLTPSTPYSPTSNSRDYNFPWTNHWNRSRCDPTILVHAGDAADIDASITQLFVTHNRMHDFSYFLGFTEANYNLQMDNFGNTDPSRENDPEIGNVQAGAVSGGAPSYLGRDNANQITLQDGVPGITNQYLFQPIAAAFYAPCADGTLDVGIVGHEYTHAISNRMIAGPDTGLSGAQGGAMGESWGDLAGAEYLISQGYTPTNDENPAAIGIYATGNKQTAIRNFAPDTNILNYSDVGYDMTGPQVHADGEIWTGTNWAIRQALIDKYNAQYPYSDQTRQTQCAQGKRNPDDCPGNRRWIQLMFDSFLLMPGAPSMLNARDSVLAADVARFGGANQVELWRIFAKRGMGELATSNGSGDGDPVPDFSSPVETNEGIVTFDVRAQDEGNVPITNAKIYVGKFEARSTQIADTDPATTVTADPRTNVNDATAMFVPGDYEFVVQAPGYGMQRFTRTISAGQNITVTFPMLTNRASITNGASVTTTATDAADIAAKNNLIDDTENTGARLGSTTPVNTHSMTVDLQGTTAVNVTSVNVSALGGPNNGGRFTPIRKFEIWTCSAGGVNTCALPTDFTLAYTSPDDAFPGTAPRPLQPQLTLKNFDIPDTAATHVQLRVVTTQCTGNPQFLGEQDNDPLNDTDCAASPSGIISRATELQVFSSTIALGLESDVSPRSSGSNTVSSTDVTQLRRFAVGLDAYSSGFNEFQRADSAPFLTLGDGVVSATDISQARRYSVLLDAWQNAGGPTIPNLALFENIAPTAEDLASPRVVRVANVKAVAGKAVDVMLEVDALGDEAVYGFTLDYDSAVLSNPRVSIGADAVNASIVTNTKNDGKIGILVDFNGRTIVSGNNRRFVTVRFDVSKAAVESETQIGFSNSLAIKQVSNQEANAMPIRFEGGTVFIKKRKL